jgi:hypothetical protein
LGYLHSQGFSRVGNHPQLLMSVGVKHRLPLTGPRQVLVKGALARVSEDMEETGCHA